VVVPPPAPPPSSSPRALLVVLVVAAATTNSQRYEESGNDDVRGLVALQCLRLSRRLIKASISSTFFVQQQEAAVLLQMWACVIGVTTIQVPPLAVPVVS